MSLRSNEEVDSSQLTVDSSQLTALRCRLSTVDCRLSTADCGQWTADFGTSLDRPTAILQGHRNRRADDVHIASSDLATSLGRYTLPPHSSRPTPAPHADGPAREQERRHGGGPPRSRVSLGNSPVARSPRQADREAGQHFCLSFGPRRQPCAGASLKGPVFLLFSNKLEAAFLLIGGRYQLKVGGHP